MKSLKNILKRGKKSTKKHQNAFGPSPAASMASISTATSSQYPRTPPPAAIYETRGIFRTLEPVWYYNVSFTGHAQNQLNEDDTSNWIRFEDHCQYVLESSYNRHHQSCQLNHPSLGPCVIEFHSQPKPKASTARQRPVTMMMMSSAPNKTELHEAAGPLPPRSLILGHNVRRVVAPVWWYEQDSLDGSKGMCRFDYKNQARLEALSDDERTKFTLTDAAFPCPFTVVLDNRKSRDQKEEMRGFMHIEIIARDAYFYQPQASPLLLNATSDKMAADIMYSDDDPWLAGGEPLVRRFSI